MRLPRLYAAGEVQLIEVRFAPSVEQYWLENDGPPMLERLAEWLGQQVRTQDLALHAWAVTPKRLLLLVTPREPGAISRAAQSIGRRLGALLKSGTVFAARFKSTLIEPSWVLRAQAWVESGPAVDGYAPDPVSWPWSSAATHAGQPGHVMRQWSVSLTDHTTYWACGNTPFDRQAAYRQQLLSGMGVREQGQLEAALSGQWALGSHGYLERVSKAASRRAVPGKRGRPKKTASAGLEKH
jgi:putative transposase